MPFPAILRSTLLISSVLAASSYALYQSNPQFRAFVDNTVNRITSAWDDLLASLSPEERQRQREAQRRELAVALGGREGAAATGNDSAANASGSQGATDDGKARRRNLWEMAERNAERLKKARDEKKPSGPALRIVAPMPVDESVDGVGKPLPTLPQSSSGYQRSLSSAPPPPPKDNAPNSLSRPAGSHQVDPVIALLAEEAGTDQKLHDLMTLVSSGAASDAQLGEFASRIHFLDGDALDRNNVDPSVRSAPPRYDDFPESSEQTPPSIQKSAQNVLERGQAEPHSRETTISPVIQSKQEETAIADSSRFQSTTMLQMFPELTEPQAAHLNAESGAARDPPISIPTVSMSDSEDDEYSTILTPTSPSLQSVSDADTEPASHISELVSEAGEDAQSRHDEIDNDTMSLTSDTSWITGVSEANSANAWEGLDDPTEAAAGRHASTRQ